MAKEPRKQKLTKEERQALRKQKRKFSKQELKENKELRKAKRQAEKEAKQAQRAAEKEAARLQRIADKLSAKEIRKAEREEARQERREARREQLKEERKASRKKARKQIIIPIDITDTTHENPNFENDGHTREVAKEIIAMADKYGDESIVITHFIDGTAISIADKAKKTDAEGDEALPYVRWRKEDDYVWIGIRQPISSGTVQ